MSTTGNPPPDRDPDPSDVRTTARCPKATGRPRDTALTRRLLETALAVAADRGFRHCNSSVVTDLAGAGKAGLYRRWPDTTSLLAEAIAGADLVQTPPPTATLEEDLTALFSSWTRPLTVPEMAAAAVLGPARHEPALRTALGVAVAEPLTAAVTAIVDRHVARGHPVTPAQRRAFQHVVHALWLSRYCSDDPPSSAEDVAELVDLALVPMMQVRRRRTGGSGGTRTGGTA